MISAWDLMIVVMRTCGCRAKKSDIKRPAPKSPSITDTPTAMLSSFRFR